MGLLSRFGRGLTQAAPIFGQMAQASLLQAAEDKKYNRLLDREEKTWERKMEYETGKQTKALAAARRSEKIKLLDTGLKLNSDRIKMETDLIGTLTVNESKALNPMNKELIQQQIAEARSRLADALERKNRITSLYTSYVDPEGELNVFSEAEEKRILTDVSIMNAASIAKDEILGYEGMATEEFDVDSGILDWATNIQDKDSIINAQLKTIDDSLAGTTEQMSEKQKKLFRDTVESYIAERQAAYTQKVPVPGRSRVEGDTTDRSDLWRDTEDQSIGERAIRGAFKWLTEGLREGIETKEGSPFFAETQEPSVQKEISKLSAEGQAFWTALGSAIEEIGLDEALNSLAAEFAALSSADKEIIHGLNSSIPVKKPFDPMNIFGASRDSGKPNVEDSIAMMFSMPTRV